MGNSMSIRPGEDISRSLRDPKNGQKHQPCDPQPFHDDTPTLLRFTSCPIGKVRSGRPESSRASKQTTHEDSGVIAEKLIIPFIPDGYPFYGSGKGLALPQLGQDTRRDVE
jgi:hypothetical protein